MPFEGERATGESLVSLQRSPIFKQFEGEIRVTAPQPAADTLIPINVVRRTQPISRVIAIDGSIVTDRVRNGFPGAEASLVQIALVSIDLNKLDAHSGKRIIPPSAFNTMDKASTLHEILPGCNIVKKDGTPPKEFFREKIFELLHCRLQAGHETLLETYRALVSTRTSTFKCPQEGCHQDLSPPNGKGSCSCAKATTIYESDPLRFHERFNDMGSSGECHGEVMRFLELMMLLNILRYFVSDPRAIRLLPSLAFVLDGPLSAFGQYAAIVPYVRAEIKRLDSECVRQTGEHLLLFSLIKTGQFPQHFEYLDFDPATGPRGRFNPGDVLLPDIKYIHKYIVYRDQNASWWGESPPTYFGRPVFYKTMSGQRVVLNTSRLTDRSDALDDVSLECFPRLGDILNISDRLSTYLYEDGFLPLVRAHSYAAIPLKLGGEIIKSLFADER